jgi:hypothetical protein
VTLPQRGIKSMVRDHRKTLGTEMAARFHVIDYADTMAFVPGIVPIKASIFRYWR